MITAAKTFLSPFEEHQMRLQGVWEWGWITNEGPLVTELGDTLRCYLRVRHVCYVSNCTLTLQLGIRALNVQDMVLTKPFSCVATTRGLVWKQCTPVFVDIDPQSLCINPDLSKATVAPATQAIMATHVFGTFCYVTRIGKIARRYRLQVIYDAAHAFGLSYQGRSVQQHGDAATLGLHATKLLHTGEDGTVITQSDEVTRRLLHMRNFGHESRQPFAGLGVKAKNSEVYAALELSIWPNVLRLLAQRNLLTRTYDEQLAPAALQRPALPPSTAYNYSYYAVLFSSEAQLLRVCEALRQEDIYPRRYLYPSLTTLPCARTRRCPIATDVTSQVLCLPLYYELTPTDVIRIASVVLRNL